MNRRLTPEQQKLAADNLGLVYLLVGKWRKSGIDEDDLMSIGHEVLMDAARLFDPKRGKFSTYAGRGIILRFSRHLRLIHEKAAIAKMKVCDPSNMVKFTVLDWDKEPEVFNKELVEIGMDALNPKQRKAIKMRFFDGMGFAEIGQVMGVTKQRVQQLTTRALQVMRGAIQQPSSRTAKAK